jgi:hypothetical protein
MALTVQMQPDHHTNMKGRFDMKPTRTHLVGMAAALSAIAIAAPVATASAATAAPAVAIASAGPDGSATVTLTTPGQTATVIGPTFITIGSATFTDTRIVVSSGDAFAGGNVAQ